MEIENEILCKIMEEAVCKVFISNDFNGVVQSKAIEILEKVRIIICDNDLDDFEKIENIIEIFYSYGIHTGRCHDY